MGYSINREVQGLFEIFGGKQNLIDSISATNFICDNDERTLEFVFLGGIYNSFMVKANDNGYYDMRFKDSVGEEVLKQEYYDDIEKNDVVACFERVTDEYIML